MQRNIASGFEDSFRRHLAVEQRRAVLETIAHELTPDTTLGDIVDAAQDLGWADGLGGLCLADLAVALFGDASPDEPVAAQAPHADPDDDDDSDELADSDDHADADDDADDDDETTDSDEEDDDEPAARSGRKPSSLDRAVDRIEKTLAAARKVRSKKAAAKVAGKKLAKAAARIPTPAPAAKPAKGKAAAKAVPAKVTAPSKSRAPIDEDEDEDDDSEAMSLDQAAKLLVPLVRKLREATMQDLEEQTKMGRRKLRFHIGQLVKHGKLRRHGMGRGTCYTVK